MRTHQKNLCVFLFTMAAADSRESGTHSTESRNLEAAFALVTLRRHRDPLSTGARKTFGGLRSTAQRLRRRTVIRGDALSTIELRRLARRGGSERDTGALRALFAVGQNDGGDSRADSPVEDPPETGRESDSDYVCDSSAESDDPNDSDYVCDSSAEDDESSDSNTDADTEEDECPAEEKCARCREPKDPWHGWIDMGNYKLHRGCYNGRVDLAVPYAEKDDAKRLGAKWDPNTKVWYAPNWGLALACKRWEALLLTRRR